MDAYHIKAGYRINRDATAYHESLEDSRLYQTPVYQHAANLARSPRIRTALDLGCGLASKLVEFVLPHCESVTGVDLPETVERCSALHPDGRWIAGDLLDPALALEGVYDLIIAADVIEHLTDPDRLLGHIRAACHPTTLVVLSTPERDLRRGPGDMGPPGNGAHVREWNAAEFCAYLASRGFEVSESRIVDLRPGMATCHLVVGRFQPAER